MNADSQHGEHQSGAGADTRPGGALVDAADAQRETRLVLRLPPCKDGNEVRSQCSGLLMWGLQDRTQGNHVHFSSTTCRAL